MFDVGANYLNKFGDVTVALYGAFMYAAFIPGNQPFAGAANQANGANLASWKQYVFGAQFGFKGFTLGGAIGWDNNGLGTNYYTNVDNDTRFYTAGIMYETGPGRYRSTGSVRTTRTVTARSAAAAPSLSTRRPAPIRLPRAFRASTPTRSLVVVTPLASRSAPSRLTSSSSASTTRLDRASRLTGGSLLYTAGGPSAAVSGNSWGLLMGMDLRF